MICVKLAKSYDAAVEAANDLVDVVAIETEYGDKVLDEGHKNVKIALNHHGDLQKNDAPSLAFKRFRDQKSFDNFIVSHIDLDVLFGLLWAGGWLKETKTTITLSELVAQADIYGFHVMGDTLKNIPKYLANKYFLIGYLVNSWIIKDDGLLLKDVSREVHKLLLKIKDIILNHVDEEQLSDIEDWFLQQKLIAKKHLVEKRTLFDKDTMYVYRAPFSLTTAYKLEDDESKIILQYNEQSRSLTLGCYDDEIAKKYFGKNGVIEPLQKFFGNTAGGKFAIGGSPREINLQPEVLHAFLAFLDREYFNIPKIIQ